MISEIISYFYLLWPATIGFLVVCFLVGIIVAISIGSFLIGFLLASYYGYHYLKKRGFFSTVWKKTVQGWTVINQQIHTNICKTFLLKGNINKIPEGPVLFIAHPHGLYSMAPFFHWGAGLTEWPKQRKVRTAISSIFFKLPIIRELCEAHGAIEANEEEIRNCLEKGESVALLTGGIRELQETRPGQMRLVLSRRRGYLRIAKSLGVPIVPVLSFGENELFPPYKIVWFEYLQNYLKKWFGIYIPIPTVSSFLNWIRLLHEPLETKVETWIGNAVDTKKGNLDTIRKKVFESIHQVYKEGKPEDYPEDIEIL